MATDQAPTAVHVPRSATRPGRGPARQPVLARAERCYALLTERPVSLYAAAVLRAGYGLIYLLFLLREFPHRDEIWGPDSPWTPALARQLFDQTGWASVLTLSDSRPYFGACYTAALVICALFALGWRTRVMSVLFAVVVASFHARAIFMTDGGDNLMLLMSFYLVFTACGRRWSLDARRAARRERKDRPARPGALFWQLRRARETLTTVLHNCGMFVIAVQVCFLYGSAGLFKVQGGSWGNGTALHYVLNLRLFQPWPALSHLADQHALLIAVAGYLTVLLQVAFPFVLFGKLKYPVLTMLLGMHVGIAVMLGLPFFSGAMITADAVFLPDRFYLRLRDLCRRAAGGARSRMRGGGGRRDTPPPAVPAPTAPSAALRLP